jgi:hypothetical protein
MNSWSDSSLNWWNGTLQWVAPTCGVLTVLAAVILIFVKTELGRRQTLQLSRLRLETAQANEKAEAERLERVKIERSLAAIQTHMRPRKLTQDQAQSIIALIGTLPPLKAKVRHSSQTSEAMAFSKQIIEALTKGGWHVEGPELNVGTTWAVDVGFIVRDTKNVPMAAAQLREMVSSMGFTLGIEAQPDVVEKSGQDILIYIGDRTTRVP